MFILHIFFTDIIIKQISMCEKTKLMVMNNKIPTERKVSGT